MNRRDRWNFQRGDSIEHTLAFGDEVAHFAGRRLFEQRFQVCAGDKDRLLGRGDDQTSQGIVAPDGIDVVAQLAHGRGVENVRARFGPIEREHANLIVTDIAANHGLSGNCRHRSHFGIISDKFQARNDCSSPARVLEHGGVRDEVSLWSANF